MKHGSVGQIVRRPLPDTMGWTSTSPRRGEISLAQNPTLSRGGVWRQDQLLAGREGCSYICLINDDVMNFDNNVATSVVASSNRHHLEIMNASTMSDITTVAIYASNPSQGQNITFLVEPGTYNLSTVLL